jgi:hypothetical protein
LKLKVLENSKIIVGVSEENGSIVKLVNKTVGKDYVANERHARLFRLMVPLTDWWGHPIDSWEQKAEKVTVKETKGYSEARIIYNGLRSRAGEFPINVECTITLAKDSDEVNFSIEIRNNSEHTVTAVMFPWISGIKEIEESPEGDMLVFPCSKMSLRDLLKDQRYYRPTDLPRRHFFRYGTGGGPRIPWINIGGANHGICIISKDSRLQYQGLSFEPLYDKGNITGISFTWVYQPHIEKGETWKSMDVAVALHDGDWHIAADKYRHWLEGWYKKPDTPRWLKESIGFQNYNLVLWDDEVSRTYDEIPKLAKEAKEMGFPLMMLWRIYDWKPHGAKRGWYNKRRWEKPVEEWGGARRLKEMLQKAEKMGVKAMPMCNGLRVLDLQAPEYKEKYARCSIKNVLGLETRDPGYTYSLWGPDPGVWNRQEQWVVMCFGVPEWRDRCFNLVEKMLKEFGFNSFFLDQCFEQHMCFDETHPHKKPNETQKYTFEFAKRVREMVRTHKPDSVLGGEVCEAVMSQAVDFFWDWGWEYRYPEPFRYTMPWVLLAYVVEYGLDRINKAFVLGFLLNSILARGQYPIDKISDFPEVTTHIRKLADLRKRAAKYLAYGDFRDEIGLRTSGGFAKLYTTEEGAAVALANLEPKSVTVDVEIQIDRLPMRIQSPSCLQMNLDGTTQKRQLVSEGNSMKISVELQPLDVKILTI